MAEDEIKKSDYFANPKKDEKKRPGRPPGRKNNKTLEAEKMRKENEMKKAQSKKSKVSKKGLDATLEMVLPYFKDKPRANIDEVTSWIEGQKGESIDPATLDDVFRTNDEMFLYNGYDIRMRKSAIMKSTEALIFVEGANRFYLLRHDGYYSYVEELVIHGTDMADTPEEMCEYLDEECERVYDGGRWIGNVSHYYSIDSNLNVREISKDDMRQNAEMFKSKTDKSEVKKDDESLNQAFRDFKDSFGRLVTEIHNNSDSKDFYKIDDACKSLRENMSDLESKIYGILYNPDTKKSEVKKMDWNSSIDSFSDETAKPISEILWEAKGSLETLIESDYTNMDSSIVNHLIAQAGYIQNQMGRYVSHMESYRDYSLNKSKTEKSEVKKDWSGQLGDIEPTTISRELPKEGDIYQNIYTGAEWRILSVDKPPTYEDQNDAMKFQVAYINDSTGTSECHPWENVINMLQANGYVKKSQSVTFKGYYGTWIPLAKAGHYTMWACNEEPNAFNVITKTMKQKSSGKLVEKIVIEDVDGFEDKRVAKTGLKKSELSERILEDLGNKIMITDRVDSVEVWIPAQGGSDGLVLQQAMLDEVVKLKREGYSIQLFNGSGGPINRFIVIKR